MTRWNGEKPAVKDRRGWTDLQLALYESFENADAATELSIKTGCGNKHPDEWIHEWESGLGAYGVYDASKSSAYIEGKRASLLTTLAPAPLPLPPDTLASNSEWDRGNSEEEVVDRAEGEFEDEAYYSDTGEEYHDEENRREDLYEEDFEEEWDLAPQPPKRSVRQSAKARLRPPPGNQQYSRPPQPDWEYVDDYNNDEEWEDDEGYGAEERRGGSAYYRAPSPIRSQATRSTGRDADVPSRKINRYPTEAERSYQRTSGAYRTDYSDDDRTRPRSRGEARTVETYPGSEERSPPKRKASRSRSVDSGYGSG